MNIVINGTDFSSVFKGCLIHPYYDKVQGPNAGISQGGSEIFDTIKVKSCFDTTVGLMSQSEYTSLISVLKQDYLTVTYDDPETNEIVTREMVVTAVKATRIPLLGGGYAYKNLDITFRER